MWRRGCVIVMVPQVRPFAPHSVTKAMQNLLVVFFGTSSMILHHQSPHLINYDFISGCWGQQNVLHSALMYGQFWNGCSTPLSVWSSLLRPRRSFKLADRFFLRIAKLHVKFNATALFKFFCNFSKAKIRRCSLTLLLTSAVSQRLIAYD